MWISHHPELCEGRKRLPKGHQQPSQMAIYAVTQHKRSRKVFSTKLEHLPAKINSEYFVPTFSKELCIETRTTTHVENLTFGSKLLNEELDDTAISTLLKVSGGYLFVCLYHDDFRWHWLKGGHCLQYLPVVPITTVGLTKWVTISRYQEPITPICFGLMQERAGGVNCRADSVSNSGWKSDSIKFFYPFLQNS